MLPIIIIDGTNQAMVTERKEQNRYIIILRKDIKRHNVTYMPIGLQMATILDVTMM